MAETMEQQVASARADGRETRFSALVGEHQAMVYSLAYHYLGDHALAEEVAQEVFLELHGAFEALESPAHIRHWLRRVASHRSIDQSRRRRLRPQVGLQEIPEPAAECPPEDVLRNEAVRKLVATLPERCRVVVVLRYQEDLEPAEIARLLGVPARLVRRRLHKGLTLLRRKMNVFPKQGGWI